MKFIQENLNGTIQEFKEFRKSKKFLQKNSINILDKNNESIFFVKVCC